MNASGFGARELSDDLRGKGVTVELMHYQKALQSAWGMACQVFLSSILSFP